MAEARPLSASASRLWTGSAFALVSAVAFAFNVACGSLVYEAGGNIHAVNYVRPVGFLICVAGWLAATGRPVRMPPRQVAGAVALGLILCFEFYMVFSAVRTIPVGLAILIMYTYPIAVALLDGALGRGRFSPWLLGALLVIFCGLALALGTPAAAVDWHGVTFAGFAALGMCALVMISQRTTAGQDPAVAMLYIMATASTVMVVLFLAGPEPVWPATAKGIAALVLTSSAYVVATFFLFVSIEMIGPVRFAAIDNTSPVWATLFGMLLLGERLAPLQWLGMALVIGGVIAAQFLHAPAQVRTSAS